MPKPMTKAYVMKVLRLSTDEALAALFPTRRGKPISRQAVQKWRDDEELPPLRQAELRLRYPRKFPLPK